MSNELEKYALVPASQVRLVGLENYLEALGEAALEVASLGATELEVPHEYLKKDSTGFWNFPEVFREEVHTRLEEAGYAVFRSSQSLVVRWTHDA